MVGAIITGRLRFTIGTQHWGTQAALRSTGVAITELYFRAPSRYQDVWTLQSRLISCSSAEKPPLVYVIPTAQFVKLR